ncbi:MAG: prolipoprotein diacylglyceryl transferase [Candidatus Melainabacteria bacterium]|nr:prolipoprotein diacylglyceryl transferase [Candidatus Melainabacteria bacterium]
MYPVLFRFFGIEIHTFGALVALAFAVGFGWTFHRARQRGEDPDLYAEAAVWIIIAAMVGARLMYVVFFPNLLWNDPLGTLLSQGGLVWYGGVLGAILALWGYSHWRGLPLLQFLDRLSPPAALGMAIGRVGCLMAGCCYGAPCTLPWAIYYPADHSTHPHGVHPSPLYESVLMLGVMFLLLRLEKPSTQGEPRPPGWSAGWFLVCYGLVRFGLEYLRGDRLVWLPSVDLSASQLISLGGVVVGGWLLWRSQAATLRCKPDRLAR